MSILNCPECGKEVFDNTTSCAHCGYSINQPLKSESLMTENTLLNQKNKKRKIIIIISTIAISILVTFLFFIKFGQKPILDNLHWGMAQSDIIKSKNSYGEMYKNKYIVNSQTYFDQDCGIVYGFDESNTLNEIELIFDNKTYSSYSNIFYQLYNLYGNPYSIKDNFKEEYTSNQQIIWLFNNTVINLLYSSRSFEMVCIGFAPVKDETKLESNGLKFNNGHTQCSAESDDGICKNTALLWNTQCYETGCQIIGCQNYGTLYKLNDKGICEVHYNLFETGAIQY